LEKGEGIFAHMLQSKSNEIAALLEKRHAYLGKTWLHILHKILKHN
jgi:hypothetical protein